MEQPRRLHIGGKQASPGWEILNAPEADYIAHICDARDLSCFEPATFTDIYASHVLEHFGCDDEIPNVLLEWHRVLKPGGTFHLSVPDLDTLTPLRG